MEGSALLGAGNTKKYDIPLSHLDYGYIDKCTDVKTLEKIYKVLKSGDEGCYPDLETFCEKRLQSLNPNSRVLRKETPVFSKRDLDQDAREELDSDLKSWTESMKSVEDHLKTPGAPVLMEEDEEDLPPVRSGNITITADGVKTSKTSEKSNKRVMPREYRDWDKIDVDKELEKVDEADDKLKQKTIVGNTVVKDIPSHVDTRGLSDSEKLLKANREKDKGNEAFRANDLKEAITYYSRSISLQPTAASFNNRALAYLKNQDWQSAVADCNKVLAMEEDNIKALLRRGTAYKGMKQYEKAFSDFNKVLELEPNNKRAKELVEETEKTSQKEKEERKTKGRRMKIEDVDEIEEEKEEITETTSKPAATIAEPEKPKSRKMKIEEVEDDDEDSEPIKINGNIDASSKGTGETDKLVNGLDLPEKDAAGKTVENESDKNADSGVSSNHIVQTETSVENSTCNSKKVVKEASEKSEQSAKSPTTEAQEDEILDNKAEVDEESKDVDNEDIVSERSEDITEESTESTEEQTTVSEPLETAKELSRPVFYMKEYPAICQGFREEANGLFKSGQYGEAQEKYSKIIMLLEKLPDQVVNLSLTYNNRAACHLKTGDLPGCIKDCNSSLELVPHNVKALLRRATAYEHLERYNKAYEDYRHVLLLDSRTEQAHLGTKRCHTILSNRDGPRWREKLQLTQVSPWDIPEIIGLDGNSINPVVVPTAAPPSSAQSTSTSPTIQQGSSKIEQQEVQNLSVKQEPEKEELASKPVKQELDKEELASNPVKQEPEKEDPASKPVKQEPIKEKEFEQKTTKKKPALTPQQKFDDLKSMGNECVKNGKFRDAIKCYTDCAEILPDQAVSYTNRALCYIRVNQPADAEEDCSKALSMEEDNVKALFRRAQARKMLKRYRDGLEDLKHLLKVEPTNAAAKKEMELLKNYWREELQNMKKTMPDNPVPKPDPSKQDSKPSTKNAQSGAGKQRKKMVIEEVESDEGETNAAGSSHQKQPQSNKDKQKGYSKIQEVQSKPASKPSSAKPTRQSSSNQPVTENSTAKPVRGKSETKQKPVNKKSQIKETSSGLPQVPKSTPKLDKATPYEFITAWNALKKSETVKPYYELLKQIKPADIKTVISSNLDGGMLKIITKCVAEHYIANGEEDESYLILKNLSTVPRFGTMAMFLSGTEKSAVQSVMEKLSSHPSSVYTAANIKSLRQAYGV